MNCRLSHRSVQGRLLATSQATPKQLHHSHSLTVPQGWWPHEAASWSPPSANLLLLKYSSVTQDHSQLARRQGLVRTGIPGEDPLLIENIVGSITIIKDLAISLLFLSFSHHGYLCNLQNGLGMIMSCLEEKAILQHLWNHEPKLTSLPLVGFVQVFCDSDKPV